MNDLRTAAQQALDRLRLYYYGSGFAEDAGCITALEAALALAQPEPVAKVELMMTGGNAGLATRIVEIDDPLRERLRPGQVLYTAPPQRKPLSLTDLQEALVYTNLIDRDAIDNPEEYDDGSTLAQIDELHRIIIKE